MTKAKPKEWWEEYLTSENSDTTIYNLSLVPGPASRVGTEEYFASTMNWFRNQAEARSRSKPPPLPRGKLPKATRTAIGEVSAGQLCAACDRKIGAGEKCWAEDARPMVYCSGCGPVLKTTGTVHRRKPEEYDGGCGHTLAQHQKNRWCAKYLIESTAV
jgi:hypothetical protein